MKAILQTILDILFPPLHDPHEVDLATVTDEAVLAHYKFQCIDSKQALYALAQYSDDLIGSLIRQLKFKGKRISAHFLALLVVRALNNEEVFLEHKQWLIVPVPLGKARERSRGYNQSMCIAQMVAQTDSVVTLPSHPLLRRDRETKPQTSLDRADRVANVIGVFSVDQQVLANYPNVPILLLDDVVTTGATLREARKTLLEAGATKVVGVGVGH